MNVHTLLVCEADLGAKRFVELLDLAADLKAAKRDGREVQHLAGRNIALVLTKISPRTSCAYQIAAHDQGAHVTFLGPGGFDLGRTESVRDAARTIGGLYHGIEVRGFAQETVEEFAEYAGVPVWNGRSDRWHPVQMLADMLTMREYHGGLDTISYSFVGNGRSDVAQALLVTGAKLGLDVRIGSPSSLQPPVEVQEAAAELAKESGARVMVTDDIDAAVIGSDFIYADLWASADEPDSVWDERVAALRPYRITPELMDRAGNESVALLHRRPSLHNRRTEFGRRLHERYGLDGTEVSDDVFESPRSVVFPQAENRVHVVKAVLVDALEN